MFNKTIEIPYEMVYHNIKGFRTYVRKELIMWTTKKLIIEMLDIADERRLKLIYIHIKALLGLR